MALELHATKNSDQKNTTFIVHHHLLTTLILSRANLVFQSRDNIIVVSEVLKRSKSKILLI